MDRRTGDTTFRRQSDPDTQHRRMMVSGPDRRGVQMWRGGGAGGEGGQSSQEGILGKPSSG